MMDKCYWNGNGRHQEWLDKVGEALPGIGYVGNPYTDALLIAKHLYYDAYNNGGGNIEDCYRKDVHRLLLPVFPAFKEDDFIYCRFDKMEDQMNRLLEFLMDKDLRFKLWGVDVHEKKQLVLYDADGTYVPTGDYAVTFGNPKERDDWVKARMSWAENKNAIVIDLTKADDSLNASTLLRVPNLKEEIEKLKAEAEACGAELQLEESDFIDAAHLDCVWYGHDFGGQLFYKDYTLNVAAYGEVRICGTEHGPHDGFSYVNKNGTGTYANDDIRQIFHSDAELSAAEKRGEIIFENNNWLEYIICDNNGEAICEPEVGDTDNLLEFFTDIRRWIDEVFDPTIAEHEGKGGPEPEEAETGDTGLLEQVNDAVEAITALFTEIRRDYPEVADYMLAGDAPGDIRDMIFYNNGNDSTGFDWSANHRLCEFGLTFDGCYNDCYFVKLLIGSDGTMDAYIYPRGEMKPVEVRKGEIAAESAAVLAAYLNKTADGKGIYDEPISRIDFKEAIFEDEVEKFHHQYPRN